MLISESYKKRIQLLAGILSEADDQTKTQLLSKSGERVPFNRAMMKQAIQNGQEVGLLFKSKNDKYEMPTTKYRIVQPVAMGTSSKGNTVIRGLHVLGQSERKAIETGVRSAEAEGEWRLFKAENIKGMWITDRLFSQSPPGFNPNDKQMRSVEVAFNPSRAAQNQANMAQQQSQSDAESQKQSDLDSMQKQIDQETGEEIPEDKPNTAAPGQFDNQFAG